MKWSPQQDDALTAIEKWRKDKKSPQVFRLFGYAGTGKTTLAKEAAANVKGHVCYAAFTGKAASVMEKKGCGGASTIHRLIYKVDDERAETPSFSLNPESIVGVSDLVILDECSMVDQALGEDLKSFGKKILVLGDPAQLPPVKGESYFINNNPDFMLTEVHRQALDNPIIAMSMKVREGKTLSPGTYGESKIISQSMVSDEQVLAADQVIVGRNNSRISYNLHIRRLLGRSASIPEVGDKLICLRNNYDSAVLNGTMWKAEEVFYAQYGMVRMKINRFDDEQLPKPVKVRVHQDFFIGGHEKLLWDELKKMHHFTYGYAITCHKSQGSQWDNILVFDESKVFKEHAQKWLYTAITRAAEKLTLAV